MVRTVPNIHLNKIFGCKNQDENRMIKKVAYKNFIISPPHILTLLRVFNGIIKDAMRLICSIYCLDRNVFKIFGGKAPDNFSLLSL